jgi:diguanylate cyclase (GGDEF)-like protein
MFRFVPTTATDAPQSAAPGPWFFMRRLEDVLQAETGADALLAAVLALFADMFGIAGGWAGQPLPDGGAALWACAPAGAQELSRRFYELGIAAWLPDDPAGNIAAAWAGGHCALTDHIAVIMLRGQAAPRGVLVLAAAEMIVLPEFWSLDILDHIGVLIGQALDARERQAAMQRGQALYQTLLRGAGILMQPKSEGAVLRQLCAELVGSGLFVSARIGELDEAGRYNWVIMRTAGLDRKLHGMVGGNAPAAPGSGTGDYESLSMTAWRTGTTQIAEDYATDPRFTPWHGMARTLGWRSMAAMPVHRGGKRWAVLTVDSDTPAMFDEDLKILLERLAGMVGHALDELDLKRALGAERETQSRLARLDPLTGMPNRLALQEHLHRQLRMTRRRRRMLGIGMLDIDEFRQINDHFGREAGDTVLRTVAERLGRALRDDDFAARLGGDEFALVLEDWSEANAAGFCARMLEAIGGPITLPGGQTVSITFSAGFTLFPLDQAEADTLLRHAGIALYAAKAARGADAKASYEHDATFWKFYQDVHPGARGPAHIRTLLRQKAVVVHYQPVIDIQTGHVVAVEALARLNDGKKLLAPAEFLKDMLLLDRNVLFHQVLDAGLAQLRHWDEAGYQLALSVNVDSQILLLDETLGVLDAMLAAHGIAPQRLVLEILETHEFLDLKKARSRLSDVRARGIRIALDDLGAGYSSILKLRDLPIDVIKLDRAFTAGLRQRPDDLAFISAFHILARTLGMVLVVEGIETDDILDALRMMGDCLAQGYGIARPMPGDKLTAWMRDYRPERPAGDPVTLLGAYAVHLNWVRVYQSERGRGHGASLLAGNPLSLDAFFEKNHRGDDRPAHAYHDLQAALRRKSRDRNAIDAAAASFRNTLAAELAAETCSPAI